MSSCWTNWTSDNILCSMFWNAGACCKSEANLNASPVFELIVHPMEVTLAKMCNYQLSSKIKSKLNFKLSLAGLCFLILIAGLLQRFTSINRHSFYIKSTLKFLFTITIWHWFITKYCILYNHYEYVHSPITH